MYFASGYKLTCSEIRHHVRYGSLSDVGAAAHRVRFWAQIGQRHKLHHMFEFTQKKLGAGSPLGRSFNAGTETWVPPFL